MKREKLETFLGKKVMVRIFDGKVCIGVLHKSGEDIFKNEPNLYYPRNYYMTLNKCNYPTGPLFRCSHVVQVVEDI